MLCTIVSRHTPSEDTDPEEVHLDYCRYGEQFRKSTKVFVSSKIGAPGLRGLN